MNLHKSTNFNFLTNPKDTINSVLQMLSEKYKNTYNILFVDEIRPINDLHLTNGEFDWSDMALVPSNVNFLFALNPRGDQFKCHFQVIPPNNSKTLCQQLFNRHRNCYEIAQLLDYFKPIFTIHYGILNPCHDTILNKACLPAGRLPVWIERSRNISDEVILEKIKSNYVYCNETVTLLHDLSSRNRNSSIMSYFTEMFSEETTVSLGTGLDEL